MSTTDSPEAAPPNPVKAGDNFPDGVKFSYVTRNGEEPFGSQLLADLTLPVKAMFRILPRRRQSPHAGYPKSLKLAPNLRIRRSSSLLFQVPVASFLIDQSAVGMKR